MKHKNPFKLRALTALILIGLASPIVYAAGSPASQPPSTAQQDTAPPQWEKQTAYNGGEQVTYTTTTNPPTTAVYTAAYWTQGNEPDKNCGAQGSGKYWICAVQQGAPWDHNQTYVKGDTVTYGTVPVLYTAAQWNQNDEPDTHNGEYGADWYDPSIPPPPPPLQSSDPIPDLPTPPKAIPGKVITTGTINFHLDIGVPTVPAMDALPLDGDRYTGLIMSNFIAGVMYGHMIQAVAPKMKFNKDYLYGSIFGQLLQENIQTELYGEPSKNLKLIDSDPLQNSMMANGQGGPWELNSFIEDSDPTNDPNTKPAGHGLINYAALQNYIGYTTTTASSLTGEPTPPSFNDIRYGPMIIAYWHLNDFIALHETNKQQYGSAAWEPDYDNTLENFTNLPNNFLDMILNVAYNAGYGYSANQPLEEILTYGPKATSETVNSLTGYKSVFGSANSYKQYPYQVHYYLDQIYDNTIPSDNGDKTTYTPKNHVAFYIPTLGYMFANVMETLGYQSPAQGNPQPYQLISKDLADTAFKKALITTGISQSDTLDLSNTEDRAKIFTVLETAITNVEQDTGMPFDTATFSQLAPPPVHN